MKRFVSALSFAIFAAGVVYSAPGAAVKGDTIMEIKVTSPAFKEGEFIPKKFTCDGENVSPAVEWSGVPATAKVIVLICDDPDAPRGTWVHWVLFNVPASTKGLAENFSHKSNLPDGSRQGINDSHEIGYDGPCPPGGVHRYYFKVYALDKAVNLESGATKAQLLRAMEGHVVAEGVLMGRYKR
ncbi:MAG TPA: YbhB/YbcL family Raf kinase inhibitor-like protein [Bacteroidota bacterium]|nr:YbhB/YbcL family Raf kinase inhibitor-like protein [Bacteroidota bacterium]